MSLINKLKNEGEALKEETLITALSLLAMLDDAVFGADARAQNGIVGTVITVVVVGVVGIVGILIFSEVTGAIALEEGHALESSMTSLEEGFGSAMELLPIVLIVLVASLVIAVISRFR